MERKRKESKQPAKISIVVAIFLTIAVGVGAGVGGFFIGKKQGYKEGEIAKTRETGEELRTLAKFMTEKAELKSRFEILADKTPEKFTADNIGVYIDEAKSLTEKVTIEEAKNRIEEFIGALEEFKGVFEGQNNGEIEEKLDELKEKVKGVETAINDIYNAKIADSLKTLSEKGIEN